MKIKRILYIILCFICLFCTACTQAPPENCTDELIRNTWVVTDSANKEHGSLLFNNGRIIFNVNLSGENFYMNEEYIIDEKKITISSENFGVFSFNYKIDGNNLILTYYGRQMSLTKKNK